MEEAVTLGTLRRIKIRNLCNECMLKLVNFIVAI